MVDKVTLTSLSNLQNETSAVAAINANNAAIVAGFDNTLSRDGTAPNTMGSTLDMDSHRIINLPAPQGPDEPLRYQDLSTFVGGGTVTNIPSGGLSGQHLTKSSNASYDIGWSSQTSELVAGTNIVLTPTTVSTSLTPTFTTVNGLTLVPGTGSITFQGTGTYVSRTSTDTLTNKTLTSPTINTPVIATPSISSPTITTAFTATGLVHNAALAHAAAFTLKGNTSGSSVSPTDFLISGLTHKASPATTDLILISDEAASHALKYCSLTEAVTAVAAGVTSIAGNTGAFTLGNGLAHSTNSLIIDNTAWTTYTPTITAGAGSFTTVSAVGRYKLWGKICFINIEITVTTVGTASVSVSATLPGGVTSAAAKQAIHGIEAALTGQTIVGLLQSGATSITSIAFYDNTFPGADSSNIVISGVFETA